MSKVKRTNNQEQKSTWRICAIFAPQSIGDSVTTIANTLRLLEPLSEQLFTITGNLPENAISSDRIHIINISTEPDDITQHTILMRIAKFMILQLKMSYNLFRIANKIDLVLLAAGAQVLFLPALSAKLLRKRLILSHLGFDALSRKDYQVFYEKTLFGIGKYVFPWFVKPMERFNYLLSDRIIAFLSNSSLPLLKKYGGKTSLGSSRFYVDIGSFKVERKLEDRENLVGYIGRFEEIKGVMNFVKAIPLILSRSPGVKVLIGGDGSQRDEIEKETEEANLHDKVTLMAWIPHDKLPRYLNEIKLLVIPSLAEVGPEILLEAMACGTPVVVTPVGVVPDVVQDGKTGFILENNSPECIAENVIRALENPNLGEITRKARKLIEERYTYELAVERYREVLRSL